MTRLVDVEGRRQGVMTVREQVAAFLRTQTTLCLCDECLGRALSIHAASAHRAAVQLSNSGDFQRACQSCSRFAKGAQALSEEASNVLDGAFTHSAVALFFLFVGTFVNSMQLLVKDVQLVEASIVRLRLRGPAAEEPAQWRRAVAPGVEVGEITIHGLALSRLKHGFELSCDVPAATRFTPPGLCRRFGRRSSPSNPWQNPPGFRTRDQATSGKETGMRDEGRGGRAWALEGLGAAPLR